MVTPFEEFITNLIIEAKSVVENSPTKVRYIHNKRIFDKLKKTILNSVGEEDFYKNVREDFELYCVVHIRLDNNLPMFPAPWQSEAVKIIEANETNLFLSSRKIGKTALLTAYPIWKCDRDKGVHVRIFAPTDEQLYIMDDIYKALTVRAPNDYFAKYLGAGIKDKKATLAKREIVFGKNGNSIAATNLAQRQEARTKRGGKGTIFIVDEIGLVTREVKETVIYPMMADVYSTKKLISVGTPLEIIDPQLKEDWKLAQQSDDTGTMHIDVWEGLRQGCISKNFIRDVVFKKSLKIHCKWVLRHGICGKVFKNNAPEPETGWVCNECCMRNETFVKEYLGRFPEIGTKFFPMPHLEACARNQSTGKPEIWDLKLPTSKKEVDGRKYAMSIDYGHLIDVAQILVGELIGKSIRIDYWEEIAPIKIGETKNIEPTSYTPVVRRAKEIYHRYYGNIVLVIPDATASGFQATFDMTKRDPDYPDLYKPIPKGKIYSNKTAKKKNVLGVWMSGAYDDYLFDNHRKVILSGRFRVPYIEPFYSRFISEHDGVIVNRPTATRPYKTFKKPKGGKIDLLVACALLSLAVSDEIKINKPYLGVVYGSPRRSFY